ncbi:thioesterase domain-containing protein [Streptomyces sp. NPDC051173]|uniref:thioesterase II family protein n=1 Tax=Streptomyces sp. NPDC051173 TaxID=3155164 RepID=UPI00344CA2CF
MTSTRRTRCSPAGWCPRPTACAGWRRPSSEPRRLEVLAVQYPGRQDRWHEPAIDDLGELAGHVVREFGPARNGGPPALFGHRTGALAACEVARRLASARLYVSAHSAPPRGASRPRWGSEIDADLITDMRRLNGTDTGLLTDSAMLELLLPGLRAEYHAVRTYQWHPSSEPCCPVRVLPGSRDCDTPPHVVRDWKRHTAGEAVSMSTRAGAST